MSGKPRQFGIDIEQVPDLRDVMAGLPRVRVIGFNGNMGTRFLEAGPIIENTVNILDMARRLGALLDIPVER